LAIEEHLTNILSYGYEPGATPHVVIRMETDAEWLRVQVEDNGKPYDPLATPPVDTSIPLEEKPIGGLGVHLMRQVMDELSFAREAGKNVIRMGKRLGAAAP
jgi:anti-sigma regulatory factor (Ser/Thr protein kinase)